MMAITKWFLQNVLVILGAIAAIVTAVVVAQSDAVVKLGYCILGNTSCIILASIAYISGWTLILALAALLLLIVFDGVIFFSKYSYQALKTYFKKPRFTKIKLSCESGKSGEILLKVCNKEWRYPLAQVEAIVNIEKANPSRGFLHEFGKTWAPSYVGNLKWKDNNNPGLAAIPKRHCKYLSFVKASKIEDELYLEVWRESDIAFPIGSHEVWVILYITIADVRITRTVVIQVLYKGTDRVSISSIIPLQDIILQNDDNNG